MRGLMILTLMIGLGCQEAAPEKAAEAVFDGTMLIGAWESPCVLAREAGTEVSMRLFEERTAQAMVHRSIIYSDSACTTPSRTVRTTAALSYGAAVPSLDSTWAVDTTIGKVELMLSNQDPVELATINLVKSFGYSDWVNDAFKDVSGRKEVATAVAQPEAGQVIYGIFRLDGDKLEFGDSSGNGSSPQARPTGISAEGSLARAPNPS